jgi:hypothetical protein
VRRPCAPGFRDGSGEGGEMVSHEFLSTVMCAWKPVSHSLSLSLSLAL